MTTKAYKIAVIGAGSWGTALASTFALNENSVMIWGRDKDDIDDINNNHQNHRFLKDAKLSDKLRASTDLKEVLADAKIILLVVPTKALREVAKKVYASLDRLSLDDPDQLIFGHAIKGIEAGTNKRISQMIAEEIPFLSEKDLFFISGPSHAESVVQKAITLVSVAGSDQEKVKSVQNALSNAFFRVYTNRDLIGSEYAAALKNVLAIAGGIVKGLGMTDNTQAALITRGLAEMRRLGVSLGAKADTFDGLAGLGDLIVTAMSNNSRNFRAGLQLADGKNIDEIEKDMGMVVEGFNTAKAVVDLSLKKNISMPISQSIYKILYENAKIDTVVADLMNRPLNSED
ncbi:NAD(P)H-dependent glycerol-3-phosphate dehydrogenase [Oenococcus alcoholitolerans]|uniref:NAD(P)H-dependent glycerol-3-phosphate dehydrogenase n=1 Tax=Oenococcus alcoholitolerans TaxID=931074 RepID=UPI003F6F43B2